MLSVDLDNLKHKYAVQLKNNKNKLKEKKFTNLDYMFWNWSMSCGSQSLVAHGILIPKFHVWN